MSDMLELNLDDFAEVKKANSGKPKPQNFRLKMNTAKQSFTFSNELFAELDLATNSMTQWDKIRGGNEGVYLLHCPANEGKWLKKREGTEKGKTHKNEKLIESLDRFGIIDQKLDLQLAGKAGGMSMYRVVVDTRGGQEVEATLPEPEPERPEPVDSMETDSDREEPTDRGESLDEAF